MLLGMRLLRVPPIHDPTPLNPLRRLGAFLTLVVFLLCFMLTPILVGSLAASAAITFH
jgi:hypothetical protein